jgi:hypothetical protein
MNNAPDRFVDVFRAALKKLGFAFFENGDYNLNLIGVRSPETRAGHFDDMMACFYKVKGRWRAHFWAMTTDPGKNLLLKPMNQGGCGILVAPQQMRGAYCGGLHKGRRALIQRGKRVKLWRDNNRDEILDWGDDLGYPAWAGINIHNTTAGAIADLNTAASAACQVFPIDSEHGAMMDLYDESASRYGKWITYTIICAENLPW